MRSTTFRFGALTLLLSFGLLACSDGDSPTESTGDLDQAQAVAMMEALTMAGGAGFLGGFGYSQVDDEIAFQQSPFDFTMECSGGGTVDIAGEVSVTGQGESFSVTQTMSHNACTETAPSDGSTWTFNGSPSVTLQLSGSVSETSISFQGSQTGTIQWSSGGQSGSCSTNVQYSMSGSPTGAVTVSISGTSCGHDVSGNFTVSN